MLQKEIKVKMMKDLGINEHRARAYAKMFCDKFQGNIRAITYVLSSYTESGDIRVSYVINDKRYHLNVCGRKPYSRKENAQ